MDVAHLVVGLDAGLDLDLDDLAVVEAMLAGVAGAPYRQAVEEIGLALATHRRLRSSGS